MNNILFTSAVFDLDNTLIDTEGSKQVLKQVALSFGLTEQEAVEVYEQSKGTGDRSAFHLEVYEKNVLARLSGKHDSFSSHLRTAVHDFSKNCILPGVRQLLEFFQEKNIPSRLFTLGDPSWQQEKISWAGLSRFFSPDMIHVTVDATAANGKIVIFKKVYGDDFSGEQVVFFDDKPDEVRSILQSFPDLFVCVRREPRDQRYQKKDFEQLASDFPKNIVWSEQFSDFLSFLKK